MADGSKSFPLILEVSDSTPLIAEYSPDEVSEQRYSDDVQQHESSTTENDKFNSGSVATTDGADTNINRAGCSSDGDDRKELIRDSEVNEAEIALREVSQGCSRQPTMAERLRSNPLQDAGNLAKAAACQSRAAAISCRRIKCETHEAIAKAQARVDKSLRKAEEAADNVESGRYRALASRYDAAIRLASTRASEIGDAAKLADDAASEAETAARKVVETNEDFNAATRLWAANNAAHHANMATIEAHKAQYQAVMAMRRCWEDLAHRTVNSGRLPTRNPEETRCGGNENGKKIAWTVGAVVLILGISLLGVAHHTKNPDHQVSLTAVGSLFVALAVCGLIGDIAVRIMKKVKKCKRKENDLAMQSINNQLGELDDYFKRRNIPFVHSNDQQ